MKRKRWVGEVGGDVWAGAGVAWRAEARPGSSEAATASRYLCQEEHDYYTTILIYYYTILLCYYRRYLREEELGDESEEENARDANDRGGGEQLRVELRRQLLLLARLRALGGAGWWLGRRSALSSCVWNCAANSSCPRA